MHGVGSVSVTLWFALWCLGRQSLRVSVTRCQQIYDIGRSRCAVGGSLIGATIDTERLDRRR